jgi:hypothetical protein
MPKSNYHEGRVGYNWQDLMLPMGAGIRCCIAKLICLTVNQLVNKE